jgi:polysaccharide export outer membrane protein
MRGGLLDPLLLGLRRLANRLATHGASAPGLLLRHAFVCLSACLLVSCSGNSPRPAPVTAPGAEGAYYRIGPGDTLQLFVWRNEELSREIPVRPDGRISVPLIEDVEAAGKTPAALSKELEQMLSEYIRDPIVTVMVSKFAGMFDQQIRVIGEAQKPQAIPYRDKMTLLDVMIAVGGLTEFASGNRAVLTRNADNEHHQYMVRLDDLIRDGDIEANVQMVPGDILIIPRRYL